MEAMGLPKSPSTLSPTYSSMVPSLAAYPTTSAIWPLSRPLQNMVLPDEKGGGALPFPTRGPLATQSILKQQPYPPTPPPPTFPPGPGLPLRRRGGQGVERT